MADASAADPEYTGLVRPQPTLERAMYVEPAAFERDLRAIWYRNWIYVCQSSELHSPREYRLLEVGDQQLIVLRDEAGELQAFHNTCRHRGSVLLTESAGTLRGNGITCPYHAWNYSLQGQLKRTPSSFCQEGFDPGTLSLYDIAVVEWRGMVFINLAGEQAEPLTSAMDCGGKALANWPLDDLQVGHHYRKEMACNWKIFWENFNECLHCPGIHPELSRLVPLYRRSLMEVRDDPNWIQNSVSDDPRFKAGLAPGAQTWSADGCPCDTTFKGLNEEEIERGHTYEVLLPTLFMVGHVDYVRVVSLLPLGPEKTALEARWLFRPETLARDDFDAAEFAAFAQTVLDQDARASELNQKGLHCLRHERGTLMAEEYEVYAFHEWVRAQLAQVPS
jgi:Rieske 2Fe-2S family protein